MGDNIPMHRPLFTTQTTVPLISVGLDLNKRGCGQIGGLCVHNWEVDVVE